MKRGLQNYYSILITAVVLVIVIGLSILTLVQTRNTISTLAQTSSTGMKQELFKQLTHRGEIIVRLLADNLINPLYLSDTNAVFQLLSNAKRQQDVKSVHVLDKKGLIIHDGIEGIPGLGKHPADPVSDRAIASSDLLHAMIDDVLYVAMPIYLGGKRLGTVLVTMSTDGIHREIDQVSESLTSLSVEGEQRQLYGVILATLFFILVGILLSIMLARRFTHPIKELASKVKDVGKGKYDIQLSFSRQDEIGYLATEFQEMVQQLRDTTVSKDFLDNIISSMNEALIVVNMDGSVSMINAATSQLLGEDKARLLSLNILDIIAEDKEIINQWMNQVKETGELVALETGYHDKNRNSIPVFFSASLMHDKDGEPKWIVCVAQDITERKQIDRMRDEFISTVSHELRTPLTSIYGTLSLLASGDKDIIDENYQKLIEVAHNNSVHLVALIDDLLDSQKIVSGKMKYDIMPLNMWDLLRESVDNNQSYATEHGVKYQLMGDDSRKAIVKVDHSRLLQVMANLLSNAAKFSPNGGIVEISLQRVDDMIEVSVRDYGDGIPSHFQKHVFERFRQADSSTTRSVGGTGLGLSISKDIIENMNGEIGFRTEQGKGTQFYFRLPAAE